MARLATAAEDAVTDMMEGTMEVTQAGARWEMVVRAGQVDSVEAVEAAPTAEAARVEGQVARRVVVGATAVPVVPTVEMGMEAAMVATKAVLVAITVVAIQEGGMVVDIRVVLEEVRLVAPEKVGDWEVARERVTTAVMRVVCMEDMVGVAKGDGSEDRQVEVAKAVA